MLCLREIPMLMKHVQEEHGSGIGGLLMARQRHDQAAAHEAAPCAIFFVIAATCTSGDPCYLISMIRKSPGFPKGAALVSVVVLKCSVFFLAFVSIHTDAEMCVTGEGRRQCANSALVKW